MTFTVIIPTRNRASLAFGLVSYLRCSLRWTCPIIVVDQSDDRGAALSRAIEQANLSEVSHVIHDKRGTSVGRNCGARLARSEWFIFLDDDVRPAADYLVQVEKYLTGHPWIDAVQLALEYGTSWESYRSNPARWKSQGPRLDERWPEGPDRDGVLWFTSSVVAGFDSLTIGLASGNFAISRQAYFGAGGFDECIDGIGEDREFGLRLWWYGYRVSFCPNTMAFHLRELDGGLRQKRSSLARLLAPEPDVGWIYFYLKWFPGKPYSRMIKAHFWRQWKRPWVVPIKIVRLYRAIRMAKRRLECGPLYVAKPQPRSQAVPENPPI